MRATRPLADARFRDKGLSKTGCMWAERFGAFRLNRKDLGAVDEAIKRRGRSPEAGPALNLK